MVVVIVVRRGKRDGKRLMEAREVIFGQRERLASKASSQIFRFVVLSEATSLARPSLRDNSGEPSGRIHRNDSLSFLFYAREREEIMPRLE